MDIENEVPKSRVIIRVERIGKYKKPVRLKKNKKIRTNKIKKVEKEVISYGHYDLKSKLTISALIFFLTIMSYAASVGFIQSKLAYVLFSLFLVVIPIILAILKFYKIAKVIAIISTTALLYIIDLNGIIAYNNIRLYNYHSYGFNIEEYLIALGVLYFVLILFMKLTSKDYRVGIIKKFMYLLITVLSLIMTRIILEETPEITIFCHIGFVVVICLLNLGQSITNKRKAH